MTPKEKAKELVDGTGTKELAIYVVDEIVELLSDDWGDRQWQANEMIGDWEKVRKEIEIL